MRRRLLASACLPALLASPLLAETTIDAKRTDPVRTATVKAGAPDDVRITAAGSLTPTGGTALTIDSVNKVTNEGAIQSTNADNSTGIAAAAGSGGGIVNSGSITIDETYAATDADKDGDLDGPFAVGAGRTGIRTAGAYTGAIANGGKITIEGNDSAGIRLGGPLTGAFTHDGVTAITGDRSVGVALDAVTGNVRLAGTITAAGQGAVAARVDGDITGALVVQGALAATGYRTTTAPADVTKLDADDLLLGGPTLVIAANVSGGIILAVPPKDGSPTDNDEDKDGIDDSKEGSAAVTSYGSAPAMQIGAANRVVTIGAVAGTGTGFGLVIDGSLSGLSVYGGFDANGLSIGGLGGAVVIAGGIGVNGKVEAISNGGSATAIRIGSGATTAEIRNAGTISAAGGGTATAKSTAMLIETGGNVATIRNSGTIRATASAADGTAAGIIDRSGSVGLIENSGTISASGALATSDRNVAIDLSANTAGATVRQTTVSTGITAPAIIGDVRFGGGNDLFDLTDGTMKGSTRFGGGDDRLSLSGDAAYDGAAIFGNGDDVMALAGTATFNGTADFGGGSDTLSLVGTSRFSGTLANAQGLAVSVAGGTLNVDKGASIRSLAVGSAGVLGVTLDKSGGTGTLIQVAGQASFAEGSKIALKLASITDAEGRYVVLRAGSLSGADTLGTTTTLLPFLYKGALEVIGGTDLAVDIVRKSSTELGLNRSQASAYNAAYQALAGDQKVAAAFLNLTDGDAFRRSLRQMLPDHAGGTFEVTTLGSRATARLLLDPNGPFKDEGRWGYWISQIALGTSKSMGDTAGYSVDGWGIASGAEYKTSLGNFGASVGYVFGRDNDRGTDNRVKSGQWELAGYWRGTWGPLSAYARGSAAKIDFNGRRTFDGDTGTEAVSRTSRGKWDGTLVSAAGGVSYEFAFGNFSLRPSGGVDYYQLKEDGYTETGGGKALDLIVAGRTSDELAVNGAIAAGLAFGGQDRDSGWLRVEVEGGRRQLVGGSLGATTAHFAGGADFTLVPEDRTSGWTGKLRAVGGNSTFRLGGELAAEQQQGRAVVSLRASVQIGL